MKIDSWLKIRKTTIYISLFFLLYKSLTISDYIYISLVRVCRLFVYIGILSSQHVFFLLMFLLESISPIWINNNNFRYLNQLKIKLELKNVQISSRRSLRLRKQLIYISLNRISQEIDNIPLSDLKEINIMITSNFGGFSLK